MQSIWETHALVQETYALVNPTYVGLQFSSKLPCIDWIELMPLPTSLSVIRIPTIPIRRDISVTSRVTHSGIFTYMCTYNLSTPIPLPYIYRYVSQERLCGARSVITIHYELISTNSSSSVKPTLLCRLPWSAKKYSSFDEELVRISTVFNRAPEPEKTILSLYVVQTKMSSLSFSLFNFFRGTPKVWKTPLDFERHP